MKNKSILITLLWIIKISRVFILIGSVVIVVATIVSQVYPQFKHELTFGYFGFIPSSEITGTYQSSDGLKNFEVNSIIVNNSTLDPGIKATWLIACNLLLTLAFTFYILTQLLFVLRNLLQSKIFQRENALKLRHIALAMISGWAITILFSLILTLFFRGSISLAGYNFQYFYAGGNWFNSSLISGIVILLIAEVFRMGTELKEESDLTI